jgi:hypothetical protein
MEWRSVGCAHAVCGCNQLQGYGTPRSGRTSVIFKKETCHCGIFRFSRVEHVFLCDRCTLPSLSRNGARSIYSVNSPALKLEQNPSTEFVLFSVPTSMGDAVSLFCPLPRTTPSNLRAGSSVRFSLVNEPANRLDSVEAPQVHLHCLLATATHLATRSHVHEAGYTLTGNPDTVTLA